MKRHTESKKNNCLEANIGGMHCNACEVLLENRLKKISGVNNVVVSRSKGTARIEYTKKPSKAQLEQAINKDGYSFTGESAAGELNANKAANSTTRDYLEIAAIFVILLALYFVLKRFDLLPDIGISDSMSLGLVFVIGLIAATSTCLAVTGGLLLVLTAKYSEQNPNLSGTKKFKPVVYFNIGRIIGYTIFGAALGALGGVFAISPFTSGVITVIAATVMVLLGLQMLRIIPWFNKIKISTPKFIGHAVHDKASGEYKSWAPFALGASTFFLPCGFTQALQLFVLVSGSAFTGGITMLVFALGTLPALLAIGAVSSFAKGSFHKHFIRFAAVLVIMLGVFSLLAGIRIVSLGF